MYPFPILSMEIDLFIVQIKLIGGSVKRGFRKEDKKIFNLWVEEIKRGPHKKNQADQIYPLDRHKKYSQKSVVRPDHCKCLVSGLDLIQINSETEGHALKY